MSDTLEAWLEQMHPSLEDVERFLAEPPGNWARFDPELGYVLKDCAVHDGMDGCASIYRYGDAGERRMEQFADQPCRINSYGDSFTHGSQVSDGETWQEVMAAHLGEPIRNFGIGGYGVYQAYRRMLRVERGAAAAGNIIFHLWHDDHRRSLFPCRWIFIHQWLKNPRNSGMFHSNPWVHLVPDYENGWFREEDNPCPTPDGLRALVPFIGCSTPPHLSSWRVSRRGWLGLIGIFSGNWRIGQELQLTA